MTDKWDEDEDPVDEDSPEVIEADRQRYAEEAREAERYWRQ